MLAVRSMKFLPAASFMARTFRRSQLRRNLADGTVYRRANTLGDLSITVGYERIDADVTRTTIRYFRGAIARKWSPLMDAGRGARAIHRSKQTASCLQAFGPRWSHPNITNRPCHRRRRI